MLAVRRNLRYPEESVVGWRGQGAHSICSDIDECAEGTDNRSQKSKWTRKSRQKHFVSATNASCLLAQENIMNNNVSSFATALT
ncbi:hypothetical protein ACROYT_G026419 [Oculina patagonica]